MPKILSICLPTYNRRNHIENQLSFFLKEIEENPSILDKVNFIIADNCSNDGTQEYLMKLEKELEDFEFLYNSENLGLVGNIINLLHHTETEYVWFVSDDDIINKGVVNHIIDTLESEEDINFMFLNYLMKNSPGYAGEKGYFTEGKSKALDIFNTGYGSLVFMTACIYRRKNLLELSDHPMFTWLSAPMLYSFYGCSKGNIHISEDTWIDFRMGNASYSGLKRVLKLKFEEYIPILEYLPEVGYDQTETTKITKDFFKQQSHSHFLYNFVNFKNSLKLYFKYYNLATVFSIPVNICKYFIK